MIMILVETGLAEAFLFPKKDQIQITKIFILLHRLVVKFGLDNGWSVSVK